ncbi:MAG: hypothetical protein K0R24_231 [Gammaproteobacteria bacterium]|jgi:hypothetical protein|nr:hypothetical protein [Gammaproteobacteria bacterium]
MLSAAKETYDFFDELDPFGSTPEEALKCERKNVFLKLSKLDVLQLYNKFFRAVERKNFRLVSHILAFLRDSGIKIQAVPQKCTYEDMIAFGISCVERRRLYVKDADQKIICDEIKLFWKMCVWPLHKNDKEEDEKNKEVQAQYEGLLNLCEWVGFDSQSYLSTIPVKVIGFLKEEYKKLIGEKHCLFDLLENYQQEKKHTLDTLKFFWTSFKAQHREFDKSPLLVLFKQFIYQALLHQQNIIKAKSNRLQNLAILIESGLDENAQFMQQFKQENVQGFFREFYILLEKTALLPAVLKEEISSQICTAITYLLSPDHDASLKQKNSFLEFSSTIACSWQIPRVLKDRIKKVSEWVLRKSSEPDQLLFIKEEVCSPHRFSLLRGLLALPENIQQREILRLEKEANANANAKEEALKKKIGFPEHLKY